MRRFGVDLPARLHRGPPVDVAGSTSSCRGDRGASRASRPIRPAGTSTLFKWLEANIAEDPDESRAFNGPGFWKRFGIDKDRLAAYFGWGEPVDATFLNDRTTIILGDQPTVGGVKFDGKRLVADPSRRSRATARCPTPWP